MINQTVSKMDKQDVSKSNLQKQRVQRALKYFDKKDDGKTLNTEEEVVQEIIEML